jgi:hypothetical protein
MAPGQGIKPIFWAPFNLSKQPQATEIYIEIHSSVFWWGTNWGTNLLLIFGSVMDVSTLLDGFLTTSEVIIPRQKFAEACVLIRYPLRPDQLNPLTNGWKIIGLDYVFSKLTSQQLI